MAGQRLSARRILGQVANFWPVLTRSAIKAWGLKLYSVQQRDTCGLRAVFSGWALKLFPLPQPHDNNLSTSLPNRGMVPALTESLWKGFMAKKTAKLKAKRKAKLRRGRQQQRQNKRIAALRKLKKRMRNKKLRRS